MRNGTRHAGRLASMRCQSKRFDPKDFRNKYLAWAFVEAANFAIRYQPRIKSFYQRKKAKSHGVVAIKAVAHKLCRACYYIMKDRVAFDVTKAFGAK